ncbi:hypothetical protein BJX61DRAFT_366242 [Aspergillus egyptiacus]|nr:hypothetical protein BJX61DRAFT_366242 [Aspergillus egyptiacus]
MGRERKTLCDHDRKATTALYFITLYWLLIKDETESGIISAFLCRGRRLFQDPGPQESHCSLDYMHHRTSHAGRTIVLIGTDCHGALWPFGIRLSLEACITLVKR